MRWLINYIHSCFCKHEWEYKEIRDKDPTYLYQLERSIYLDHIERVCKKCGWHRRYRKF